MFYRAGSLLLVLLVLGCLQSYTQAQNANGPKKCCFDFYRHPIPLKFITAYEKTRSDCPKPGVIITIQNGHSVCAIPSMNWVKRTIHNIDQQQVESST